MKSNPRKYWDQLHQEINYDDPEIEKPQVKCEIANVTHGEESTPNAFLRLKVFKIINPKKGGTGGDSDSDGGPRRSAGSKNIRAMVQELQNMGSISADELKKRIDAMHHALKDYKKQARNPNNRKGQNIITPALYEKREIEQFEKFIKDQSKRYLELRNEERARLLREEEQKDQRLGADMLLQENVRANFSELKKGYPLKENINRDVDLSDLMADPHRRGDLDVSPMGGRDGDTSGLNESAMLADKPLLTGAASPSDAQSAFDMQNQNHMLMEEIHDDYEEEEGGAGVGGVSRKNIFADEDLFKGIKKAQIAKKTKAKGEDGKEEDGEGGEGGNTADGTDEEEDAQFMDQDTGSVASSTKSLMKHLRMLRNALYENYSPPSISNLKLSAKFVFFVLLIITIVWFFYLRTLYKQIKDNIENIHSSKYRMNSLTDIGADVRILSYMAEGKLENSRSGRDYERYKRENLEA